MFTVYPAPSLASDTLQFLQKFAKINCDGVKETVWCELDDSILEDSPDNLECFVPCAYAFEKYVNAPGAPTCTERVVNLCDDTGTSLVPFVFVISDCGGKRTRARYTTTSYASAANSDDLVNYTIVGDVVDCASGTVYVEPPVECDEAEVVLCEDPCKFMSTYINGRPQDSNPWAWGDVTGDNLNAFEDALRAAGYNVIIGRLKHSVCPPIDEELFINGVSVGVPPVELSPESENAAPDRWALLTKGCSDNTRDDLLRSILNKPTASPNTHLIEGCLAGATASEPKISAFTVVDDAGNGLFAPRPLTSLGFVECC